MIGVARSAPIDRPVDLAAIVPNRVRRMRGGWWQRPSPVVWPAADSYALVRSIAARVLPGARFKRRLYSRYTLVWIKP